MTLVFVYAKEGKIKVLGINEAKNQDSVLKEEGWTHTKTLDACVYIEYLHNERTCYDRGTDIELLSHLE